MKKSTPIACLLLLSIGLNIFQFLREGNISKTNDEDSEGVWVKSFDQNHLVSTAKKLTLRDIETQFCENVASPHVVIYPKLANTKDKICTNYHELRWNKPLPDGQNVYLSPGDEVHIYNRFPLKNGREDYRVTDLTSKQGNGSIYVRAFGSIHFGHTVFRDAQFLPSATESYSRFVVSVTAKEKAQLIETLAVVQANQDTAGTGAGYTFRSTKISKPVKVNQWTWEAGTDLHQITAGNDYLDIYIDKDSSFIYYVEDHD